MAAQVTVTGTVTTPQIIGRYVGGSGVEIRGQTGTQNLSFDSRGSSQRGANLFDELNQFISAISAAWSVPGDVVIDQLYFMLADLRRNPAMGERVYAP